MLKLVFWTTFLLLNLFLWYVNVLVMKSQRVACRQESPSSPAIPPRQRYDDAPRSRTVYPEARNIRYFLDNPNICKTSRPVALLYVVSSSPSNFENRKAIRSTFANSSLFVHNIVRVAFFVGTVKSNLSQQRLVDEHGEYGDIIQSDFLDAYRNLTRKVVREFHWVTTRCENVEAVAKIDDDVFVDTILLLSKYKQMLKTDYEIICNRFYTDVNREGKWAVEESFFKGHKAFPYVYCSGYVVILKGEIISKLLKAVTVSPFVWVDDLYFSGILPSKLGKIRTLQVPNMPSRRGYRCFFNSTCEYVFGVLSSRYTRTVWNITIQKKHGKEVLSKV